MRMPHAVDFGSFNGKPKASVFCVADAFRLAVKRGHGLCHPQPLSITHPSQNNTAVLSPFAPRKGVLSRSERRHCSWTISHATRRWAPGQAPLPGPFRCPVNPSLKNGGGLLQSPAVGRTIPVRGRRVCCHASHPPHEFPGFGSARQFLGEERVITTSLSVFRVRCFCA